MGGNRFKNTCSPIKLANITPTLDEYKKELKRLFPKNEELFDNIITLGSVYKKDESGDIDIGIEITSLYVHQFLDDMSIDWMDFVNQIDKFKKRSKTATDEQIQSKTILFFISKYINTNSDLIVCDEKVVTGNMFTEFPQYDDKGSTNENVQIDWMVGDLDWLKFSYYSSKLSGNLKGLHRTQLIVAMFANKGYVFSHTNGVKNKETQEIVCSTPDECLSLLQQLYTSHLTMETLYNFTEIYNLLKYENMVFDFDDVMDTYLTILDKTRCDIPDVLQRYYLENKEAFNWTGKFLPDNSNLKLEEV